MGHSHPANIAHHDQADLGARAADRVASFLGSWKFIAIQTALIVIWVACNAFFIQDLVHHKPFDPYPFILLNLAFSTQAAYAAPILQLASNRQSEHDRLRAEHDHQMINQHTEMLQEIRAVLTRSSTVSQDEAVPPSIP